MGTLWVALIIGGSSAASVALGSALIDAGVQATMVHVICAGMQAIVCIILCPLAHRIIEDILDNGHENEQAALGLTN